MVGKNGLNIYIQQKKCYQNGKLFVSGFEKVLKMQASVSHPIGLLPRNEDKVYIFD